jgi:hypothetical protein
MKNPLGFLKVLKSLHEIMFFRSKFGENALIKETLVATPSPKKPSF